MLRADLGSAEQLPDISIRNGFVPIALFTVDVGNVQLHVHSESLDPEVSDDCHSMTLPMARTRPLSSYLRADMRSVGASSARY
jgi:hypothetical protein